MEGVGQVGSIATTRLAFLTRVRRLGSPFTFHITLNISQLLSSSQSHEL